MSASREHSFIARVRFPVLQSVRFSSVLRLASGAPYTPLLARVAWQDDAGEVHYHGLWGDPYSRRTSAYGRLDLRIDRDFSLFGRRGTLFLEVLNSTNRANTISIQWDNDFEERTAIHGLPLLPFLGLSF